MRGPHSNLYARVRIFLPELRRGQRPARVPRAPIQRARLEITPMLDAALIALGFAFLGAAILYVYACDRL